jgi:cbb3-type cytochrome oxidase subunit 3
MLKFLTFWFAFVILLIIGFFAFVVWIIRKANKPKGIEDVEKEQQAMFANVQDMKRKLVPWGSRSSKDISVMMRYKFIKGMAARLRGTILS